MQNEQVVFKAKKADLLKEYNNINSLIPEKVADTWLVLEFDFNNDVAKINSIGMSSSIDCESNYRGKVLIPYQIFEIMALHSFSSEITVTLTNNRLAFDNKSYKSKYIVILKNNENDKQEDIILSLNYSDLELISLRYRYNVDYLKKRELLYKVEKAEEQLTSAISNACDLLNEFEIKPNDIKELIMKKMERYLD